jgi:hypothetical protein
MLRLALACLVVVATTGCSGSDHAGVPRADARIRADSMARTYSVSPRARGSQLTFQRIEPATSAGRDLWVGTYRLLWPPTREETTFCVYITTETVWAHRIFEESCVKDGEAVGAAIG